jgi:aminomethyltransferase
MSESTENLKRTTLYETHKAAGARLVPFAGWEMPVQYEGVIPEHKAVRTAAGLFDVSHMGEFLVEGPGALAYLNGLLTNDIAKVADGQAQYNVMLYANGTIVDDLIVYRRSAESWLVIVNAGNIFKDYAWMKSHLPESGVTLVDESDKWALLALQGPKAAEILQPLTAVDLSKIGTYRFAEGEVASIRAVIARTGYTGEDGFELAVGAKTAPALWAKLMDAGAPKGLKPVGLGARDTLRLEMKYALYGNDIDDTTNPLEAGLGWVVKLGKGVDFIGKASLDKIKADGVKRKLVGFEMTERGIARHGYTLVDPNSKAEIGICTSGTQSPSLDRPIGVGYVTAALAAPGTEIAVDIRGEARKAKVVETPFYKRPS